MILFSRDHYITLTCHGQHVACECITESSSIYVLIYSNASEMHNTSDDAKIYHREFWFLPTALLQNIIIAEAGRDIILVQNP